MKANVKKPIDMRWEWNWPRYLGHEWTFTLFEIRASWDRKGDHTPGFHFGLNICGLQLLEFGYYNIHHEDSSFESDE
jgi:hypothetical protein